MSEVKESKANAKSGPERLAEAERHIKDELVRAAGLRRDADKIEIEAKESYRAVWAEVYGKQE